jgi:dipeptidyl aminopeptidase/acylaminoacyl peptidase
VAQTRYKLPPREVVEILDAPPEPHVFVSPTRDAMLLAEYRAYPSIDLLAEPFLRLGGIRVNPKTGCRQTTIVHTGLEVRPLDGSKGRRIELPPQARIGTARWSPDGKRIAFTVVGDDRVALWIADTASGRARPVAGIRLNDLLGPAYEWTAADQLLVCAIPTGRGPAPAPPAAPEGPNIEESSGRFAKPRTYQDLLKNPYDEALFRHYAACRLVRVSCRDGKQTPLLDEPGLYLSAELSPDGRYLLVTWLKEPFSRRVPYDDFARSTEVWSLADHRLVRTIADLPIADDVPPQGVPRGPRRVHWQALRDATLVWVEALDDGDPRKQVPHRDRLMIQPAPFTDPPVERLKLRHRFTGLTYAAAPDVALLSEYDRERRWRTTYLADLGRPDGARSVLFDLSAQDAYQHPGSPVLETRPDGQRVLLQDGDWAYFAGEGATETGDRPFLDRRHLRTGAVERLFRSGTASLERFLGFAGGARSSILISRQSKTEPPNFAVLDLKSRDRTTLTDFKDPAPQLTGLKKELIHYRRKDGVPLSGTLFLPPGYQEGSGTRLPLIVWAYPLEYSDASTAGQVRSAPNAFTRLVGPSPLFFVTQGYAVLNDATMPVVGTPETMNDTYLQQIADSAAAAIAALDARGLIDPKRVGIAGHSYGAFMTANLLAHTDLFAAGIARSGAYNRTLTPFGFQGERRSYWEAPELYMKISPFMHADRINEPILLIHGEADNNPGTHTIQSERMFEAIKGNGGTVRLVLLPHESHGYRARESVLHVIAEMLEWADKHVKNRSAAGTPQ